MNNLLEDAEDEETDDYDVTSAVRSLPTMATTEALERKTRVSKQNI